jgi:hypothetical protein
MGRPKYPGNQGISYKIWVFGKQVQLPAAPFVVLYLGTYCKNRFIISICVLI